MQGGMPAEGPGPIEGGAPIAGPGAAGPTIIPDDPDGGGAGPGPTAGPTIICARAAVPGPISSAAASSATRVCVMAWVPFPGVIGGLDSAALSISLKIPAGRRQKWPVLAPARPQG